MRGQLGLGIDGFEVFDRDAALGAPARTSIDAWQRCALVLSAFDRQQQLCGLIGGARQRRVARRVRRAHRGRLEADRIVEAARRALDVHGRVGLVRQPFGLDAELGQRLRRHASSLDFCQQRLLGLGIDLVLGAEFGVRVQGRTRCQDDVERCLGRSGRSPLTFCTLHRAQRMLVAQQIAAQLAQVERDLVGDVDAHVGVDLARAQVIVPELMSTCECARQNARHSI